MHPRFLRGGLRALCASLALLCAADASSIGLGMPSLDSGLGEPLRLSVPVTLQPDEDVGCIQVRARGNDLPGVFNTRTRVVRNGERTSIEITSGQAVDEPAVGLVVSVGCTSAVAREYVLFLDPPLAAPEPPARPTTPRSVVEPAVPRGVAQATPRPRAAATSPDGAAPSSPPSARAKRPPRVRTPAAVAPSAAPPLATAPAKPSPAASATPPATVVTPLSPKAGDRLSVAPADAQPTSSPSTPPAAAQPPATSTAATPATPAGDASATASTSAPGAPAPSAAADDITAREQSLRQQQDALQAQIKALNDQIAALRSQTTALATRNQALEENASTPLLVWVLIALALVAVLVAAWLAWRYTQLRRELEGAPWWTGNTMATAARTQAAPDPLDDADDGGLAPLAGETRMAARASTRTDPRGVHASASTAVQRTSTGPDRSRAMARSQSQQAIDTDFTLSDIEAAMATVRTIPPPRKSASSGLEDSEFGGLGGATITSAFSDPPPAAKAAGPFDEPAEFLDMDIPPRAPAAAPPLAAAPAPVPAAPRPAARPAAEAPIPYRPVRAPDDFDPLAPDSHKQTEIVAPQTMTNLELQAMPTMLDFELPSATQIAALTAPLDEPDPTHGASALDDLFDAEKTALGPDTILDLDDRHGSPLSATEVDRLTGDPDGVDALAQAPLQVRMTRFADLMNQVDEVAKTDPLRAITQLRQFVLRDENIPTLLWLRLFGLYQAVDKRMVYEALAEHFARRYHRPMVGWSEKLGDRVPQTPLAGLGDLDAEIEAAWGTEAGLARLRTLLFDRDQPDEIVFNAVLQRDLLDAAKIFLLKRDSSIARGAS